MAATSEPGVSLRMGKKRSVAVWVVAAAVASVILGTALFFTFHRKPVSLRGAVTMQDPDPKKELPIADVEITAANELKTVLPNLTLWDTFESRCPSHFGEVMRSPFNFGTPVTGRSI